MSKFSDDEDYDYETNRVNAVLEDLRMLIRDDKENNNIQRALVAIIKALNSDNRNLIAKVLITYINMYVQADKLDDMLSKIESSFPTVV